MSNLITQSKITRVVSGVAGVLTLALMLGGVLIAPSSAQALTQAEATTLISILGLTGTQAAAVQMLVTGGSSSTGGTGYVFTTTLKQGSTGAAVMELQKALNKMSCCVVAATGVGSAGMETSYFGPATKAAVVKFQNAYASDILTPIGLTSGTGLFGPASIAKMNALNTSTGCTVNCGGIPVTGTLTVSLSPSSPAQGAVIAGQGIADLAHFTFTNGSSSEAVVSKVELMRTGISNDSSFSNIYLYDGGKRLTDSASVTNGTITFNDSTGVIRIPGNSSKTISVRADIASSAVGQVIGVSLKAVTANVTVGGLMPINGAAFSVATATLATVDIQNSTATPSTAGDVEPQTDYRVWQNTMSVSQHAVDLRAMTFRNIGSTDAGDITNLRLYVDGAMVGTSQNMGSDRYVTFDLGSMGTSTRLATGSHQIWVTADIVGGSSRTFQFQIRSTGDIVAVDAELGAAVIPTKASSSFGSVSTAVMTIAGSSGGNVTVTKASNSPTENVTSGASSVKLATFEFRATGERMRVESLDVNVATNNQNGGLDNGKVYVNGAQVGSTKDLTEETDVNFTFGSSFVINPGTTAIVDIYADTKTTTGTTYTSGSTVAVTVGAGSSNAQGMDSFKTRNVPSSDTAGNTVTMSSANLSVNKFSGYGNQTREAGTTGARLGSFTIAPGSTEGVNVNSIAIALSSTEAASITNLKLVDNATGSQIGTTLTPSTGNAFSVNFTVAQGATKVIDIVGDILGSAGIGAFVATVDQVDGTGVSTGNSATYTTDTDLQTITIGSGTLSLTNGAGDPNSTNIIAGATSVKIGEFRFAAANSGFSVQKVLVLIPNAAASSTSAIKLRVGGNIVGSQTASSSAALTSSSAQFEGLSINVPANDETTVEVLADLSTTPNGAVSGAGLSATIDYNDGFRAVSGSGSAVTSVGSANVSGNTHYVKRSIPTFTKQSASATPATGVALYKFTIAADAAGAIEVKKVTFTVATSSVTVTDFYLREVGQSSNINDVNGQATAAGLVSIIAGAGVAPLDSDVISVAAGSSKTFELFGTVSSWNASGDSLIISFTEDSSPIANASSQGLSANQIWSDRSATSHTTITADWTNGYLIKDFSGDVQSFSYGN